MRSDANKNEDTYRYKQGNRTGLDKDGYNRYGYDQDGFDRKGFDPEGYDREGYDFEGFDRSGKHKETGTVFSLDGYDRKGYDWEGFNRSGKHEDTGTGFSPKGYDREGYDRSGIHKETGTLFSPEGYDREGYDQKGYDREGYDQKGKHRETGTLFSPEGYDREGYDLDGFDFWEKHKDTGTLYSPDGYDREGYNRKGYNLEGFDRKGFNLEGFDRSGKHRDTGTLFSPYGYDWKGYDRKGYDRSGKHRYTGTLFSPEGYDRKGYDRLGYDREGFDCSGKHRETGTLFSPEGYDQYGYDQEDYDRSERHRDTGTLFSPKGYDRYGFDRQGFDRHGFDRQGYNLYGFDHSGIHRDTGTSFSPEGYDRYGYDSQGFDRSGKHRETGTLFSLEGYDRQGFNEEGYDKEGNVPISKWQEIVNSTTSESSEYRISWALSEEYPLTSEDKILALGWADGERTDDYTKARMFSARTAEKFSVDFYQNLGFGVEDISLSQVSNHVNENRDDWKLFDLLLDNRICIDVKNARTSLNGNANYVEHCVSRFKDNRKGQNITIAGVLSPYLSSDKTYHYDEGKIQFLGETSYSQLLKLQGRFTNRFLKVSLGTMNFIPRWFFEFPDKFYELRNIARAEFRKTTIAELPALKDCEINPLPAYLSSGIDLPKSWRIGLEDWQINFYNRIRPRSDSNTVTMPILFLALLTHFLETLVNNNPWENYEPANYRQLLYACEDDAHSMPLGIYDPLKTINDLIGTFVTLWNNKEKIDLELFELFKFNGLGLLQGKKVGNENYETILAYCGGFVDGKGKCGNSPLIIGVNETCPDCGKLICEKCGHCSSYCSLCKERMMSHL